MSRYQLMAGFAVVSPISINMAQRAPQWAEQYWQHLGVMDIFQLQCCRTISGLAGSIAKCNLRQIRRFSAPYFMTFHSPSPNTLRPVGDGVKRLAHDADLKGIVVIRTPHFQLVPCKLHRFWKQHHKVTKRNFFLFLSC